MCETGNGASEAVPIGFPGTGILELGLYFVRMIVNSGWDLRESASVSGSASANVTMTFGPAP